MTDVATTVPTRRRLANRWTPWGFLGPALVLAVGLRILPFLVDIGLSTTRLNIARPYEPTRFVGLENYSNLLHNEDFWQAVKTTALILGPALVLEMIIGLGLALWLANLLRGRSFARSLLLLPFLLTPVVIGTFFRMFYSAEFGQLNHYLTTLNLLSSDAAWLTDPGKVRWAIVAMEVWHSTPFVALLCLAGLLSLSREPQEAALVDGATRWQRLRYVTLPMLAPVILVTLALRAIDAVQLFDEVYVSTGGGPGRLTEVFNVYLYRRGFQTFELGFTSAAAIMLTLLVSALGLLGLAARSWHRTREAR